MCVCVCVCVCVYMDLIGSDPRPNCISLCTNALGKDWNLPLSPPAMGK